MDSQNDSRLPENTVEYYLFTKNDQSCQYDVSSIRQQLCDKIVHYYGYCAKYLTNYIWHHQPFCLNPVLTETNHYIYGRTNFDNNIEDEWFIVFLLKQLTKLDPDLVVKVNDDDGEFLLIESAQVLRKWAQEPDKTANRVYLFRNNVHLVSPNDLQFDGHSNLKDIDKAVKFVVNNSEKTRCNEDIQNCVLNRIAGYPNQIYKMQHHSHCHLPITVASILDHNPKLISHAIRAFYYRTPDDLKTIISMKYFPPEICVLSSVKFTRCLFAQLTSQEFCPDIRTGWKIAPKDSEDYNTYLNGVKIAIGFEIIVSNYLSHRIAKTNNCDVNIEEHKLWESFLSNLKRHDYFGNELIGSNHYKEQMDKCKLFFKEMFAGDMSDSVGEDYESEIFNYIQNVNIEDELKKLQSKKLEPAEDESWLHIYPDELDKMLADKFGCSSDNTNYNNNNLQEYSKNIPKTLKQFVFNENSGLKGAEVPKKIQKTKSGDDRKERIHVDEEEFSKFIKEIEFLVENKANISDFSDNSTDSSDMESYEYDELNNTPIVNANMNSDNSAKHKCDQGNTSEIKAYMTQMDSELAQTLIGQSFAKCTEISDDIDSDDDDSSGSNMNDMDLNALSNIIESHRAENELPSTAGPTTALFASMGVKLPDVD